MEDDTAVAVLSDAGHLGKVLGLATCPSRWTGRSAGGLCLMLDGLCARLDPLGAYSGTFSVKRTRPGKVELLLDAGRKGFLVVTAADAKTLVLQKQLIVSIADLLELKTRQDKLASLVERLHDRVSYFAGRIPVRDSELGLCSWAVHGIVAMQGRLFYEYGGRLDPALIDHDGNKMHCGNVVIDVESFERAELALAERQALVEQPLRMDWDLDQMQAIAFST